MEAGTSFGFKKMKEMCHLKKHQNIKSTRYFLFCETNSASDACIRITPMPNSMDISNGILIHFPVAAI